MVLLMFGAFRGERAAPAVNWLSIAAADRAPASWSCWLPAERLETFGGSFVRRRLRALPEVLALLGSAAAILCRSTISSASSRTGSNTRPDPALDRSAC